jgi:hypothetical protein
LPTLVRARSMLAAPFVSSSIPAADRPSRSVAAWMASRWVAAKAAARVTGSRASAAAADAGTATASAATAMAYLLVICSFFRP